MDDPAADARADLLSRGLRAHRRGDSGAAWRAYARRLALAPGDADARYLLAVLARSGAAADAARLVGPALALWPDSADAWTLLARARLALGDAGGTDIAFRRALALAPGTGVAWLDAAQARFAADERIAAGHCLRLATCRLDPRDRVAWSRLAMAWDRAGHPAAAGRALRRALALAPGTPELWVGRGELEAMRGDRTAADASLRRALTLDATCPPAHYGRARLGAGDPDREIADLEGLLGDALESAETFYRFALGRRYDALGAFDSAFPHYARGNALVRARSVYDPDADAAYLESVAAAIDAPLPVAPGPDSASTPRPIFIVGMPRSGTSLLEQILAAHTAVAAGGELMALRTLVERVPVGGASSRPGFPENVGALDRTALATIGDGYRARVSALAHGAAWITDKLPSNLLLMPVIRAALPEAVILYCRRDPRDVCLSCFQTWFEAGQDFAYDLGELGRHHRGCARLVAHWRQLLPEDVHEVVYERLVTTPEAECRRLFDLLGLRWEPAVLRFHQRGARVATASLHQVRRPIHAGSVGRWRGYARHLRPLFAALEAPAAGKE